MVKVNDLIRGKIEKLAFQGRGIMKHEGFVLFIPFTAAGDEILCRVTEVKKNYAIAEIVNLLTKSPQRVEPACPHFLRCGGCQLQHLSYEQELIEKKSWILDSLERIGGLKNIPLKAVTPSPKEYGYRNHITLTLINKSTDGKPFLGYFSSHYKNFFKVEDCPIFFDTFDESTKVLTALQKLVQKFENEGGEGQEGAKMTLFKDQKVMGSQQYLIHFDFKFFPKNSEILIPEFLKENTFFKGVLLSSKNKKVSMGEMELSVEIDGIEFTYSTSVFMQNNREQSLNILQLIKDFVKRKAPTKILDLYCGIGIYSLLFATKGIEVMGIEFNPQSIKTAIQNQKKNGIKKAKFLVGKVEELLEKVDIPDFIILNPPREGVDKKVIELLRKKRPKNLIYISCMPTTLARDLALLNLNEEYVIEECVPFDMFPKTTHVETVVLLSHK